MNYKIQVEPDHYEKDSYDSQQRFVSYFNQKDFILKLAKEFTVPRILEIGKGNGFNYEYLKKRGLVIKTMDIDPALKPDYVGDIYDINKIINSEFDIIACFEVLEHIKFEDVDEILHKISMLKAKYLVISVPQSRLFFSFWLQMNVVGTFQKYFNLPFPIKHTFVKEHYWELGKKGYSLRSFRKLLSNYFKINKEFVNPLNPSHRFFILSRKDNLNSNDN